jgi:type I restriction enzyme, S subunit
VKVTALPKDWDLLPLGEVAHVYAGGTPSRAVASYWGGEIPWVTTAEVDAVYITSSRERITTEALSFSAAKIAQPGTLLLAMYGQGKTRGKVAMLRIPSAMNQACAAIEVGTRVDAGYLLYYLSAQYDAIRGMSNSGSQDNLSGDIVKGIPVAVPPMPEQRAIVAVLDDVTGLTKELEGLIAKKHDIKQGMLQELLTGRIRLPGFTGEWREERLGDHVSYVKTVALSRDQLDEESPLRYLHYGDIHTRSGVRLNAATESMPRAQAVLAGRAGRLVRGDVIFADASEDPAGVGRSVEVTAVPAEGVVPGLHTIAARFDKQVLADGFKAYLQFIPKFRESLLRLAAGTKVLATTRNYISSICLLLPDAEEQRAISRALEDSDAEIAVLELRLESARAIKTGMMQELLTGQTRLPVEAAS